MPHRIAVFNSGISNIHSVVKAIEAVAEAGTQVVSTQNPEDITSADSLVVPGVGNFGAYLEVVQKTGVAQAVDELVKRGNPVLGVCVGMQAFFAGSEEAPGVEGLGYFPAVFKRIEHAPTVPHMGWNQLQWHSVPAWLVPVSENATARWMYFDHSFCARRSDVAADDLTASASHGEEFAAIVCRDNLVGVQFHPEKSAGAGLELYRRFCAWKP